MGADRAAVAKPCARGRPRRWPTREVENAIFYVLRGGMAWRLPPSDLPPKSSTVFRWFSLWRYTGVLETINHLLVTAGQERMGGRAHGCCARQPQCEDHRERRPARL